MHTFELYRGIDHGGPSDLGNTEAVGAREVTLPLYPGLKDDHAAYIADREKELLITYISEAGCASILRTPSAVGQQQPVATSLQKKGADHLK